MNIEKNFFPTITCQRLSQEIHTSSCMRVHVCVGLAYSVHGLSVTHKNNFLLSFSAGSDIIEQQHIKTPPLSPVRIHAAAPQVPFTPWGHRLRH